MFVHSTQVTIAASEVLYRLPGVLIFLSWERPACAQSRCASRTVPLYVPELNRISLPYPAFSSLAAAFFNCSAAKLFSFAADWSYCSRIWVTRAFIAALASP